MDDNGDLYLSDPRASSAEGFIAALMIFAKYWKDGLASSYMFGSGHEIIYIYEIDLDTLSADSEDGKLLIALGFHTVENLDGWAYYT